ncbi:hypothetical protein FS837_006658 [Tulasnella sp. UAMH 9824]|nr:hypothetical protein FS837_006658 [Tulasnella sp. UAMH 9824]
MSFKSLLASLLLVSAPAVLAAPKVWDITVGGPAGPVYTPNQVTAEIGDVLSFHFQSDNYTVTQSTFAAPCTPMAGGFDSGYMPVATGAIEFPVYNVTVQTADPIWIHCKQVGYCGMGMVFAANAPQTDKTFDAFYAAATATASTGGYYKRDVAEETEVQPERRRWSRVAAKREAY